MPKSIADRPHGTASGGGLASQTETTSPHDCLVGTPRVVATLRDLSAGDPCTPNSHRGHRGAGGARPKIRGRFFAIGLPASTTRASRARSRGARQAGRYRGGRPADRGAARSSCPRAGSRRGARGGRENWVEKGRQRPDRAARSKDMEREETSECDQGAGTVQGRRGHPALAGRLKYPAAAERSAAVDALVAIVKDKKSTPRDDVASGIRALGRSVARGSPRRALSPRCDRRSPGDSRADRAGRQARHRLRRGTGLSPSYPIFVPCKFISAV